jgi:hypothetical protein
VAPDWPVPLRADQLAGPSDLTRSERSISNVLIQFYNLISRVEVRSDGRDEGEEEAHRRRLEFWQNGSGLHILVDVELLGEN